MTPERLKRFLQIGVRMIQDWGPEPEEWVDRTYDRLMEEGATYGEWLWLSPRLTGYAHGVAWGFECGIKTDWEVYALGKDDLDSRRN